MQPCKARVLCIFLLRTLRLKASLIIFFKPHSKQLGRLDLNAGQFHTNARLLLTAGKELREKKWRTRSGRGEGMGDYCLLDIAFLFEMKKLWR